MKSFFQKFSTARIVATNSKHIATDLTWIDMVKGLAIIGVFFDNWNSYFGIRFPGLWGPFVQVFFILSGFGLALAYFNRKDNWNWRQWTWRRITKVVMPYIIAVVFSFTLGVLGTYLYPSVEKQFSWGALLAYLTFTRNFFPSTWGWNNPLWFMPVIIGLYISFPILLKILEKWGIWVLLVISILITYGSILVLYLGTASKGHGSDLFLNWMIQFSLGIVLAYVRSSTPNRLQSLIGLKAFLLGVGLFTFSWGLRTYAPYGQIYNDMFTSVGIFLILLNFCWISRLQLPTTEKFLGILGRHSYLMYLIHFPIIAFLIGPPLRQLENGIILGILGGIYIIIIFYLCYYISQPINRLSSWLYCLFFPLINDKFR